MPNDPCPDCGGSLQVPATPDRDLGGEGQTHHHEPCPRCLSVAATPELRAHAQEWLGADPWGDLDGCGAQGCEQWSPWTLHDAAGARDVVPAWLGAGRDLLARALARRWDGPDEGGYIWRPAFRSPDTPAPTYHLESGGHWAQRVFVGGINPTDDRRLPDSSRLVDARALVLAWEQDRTPAG